MIEQQPAQTTVSRFNRVVMALLRRGVPLPGFRLLTVNGRRTGRPHTTPVTPFTYEGRRYVMQGWPRASWVANARAAGWGLLGVGRRMRRVTLTELPVEERRPILRHNGRRAPKRIARMFVENGLIASIDAESWAAAAPSIAVFRLEEA